MIGIDTAKIISSECPRYPVPTEFDRYRPNRIEKLTTFQADSEEAVKWLVVDALRAASRYIGWAEASIGAADRELLGICLSAEDGEVQYHPKDISLLLETRKMLGEISERLRKCQTSNQ